MNETNDEDRDAPAGPAVPAIPEPEAGSATAGHPNENPTVPIAPYADARPRENDQNETRPYPPFAFPWEAVERQNPPAPPAPIQPYGQPPAAPAQYTQPQPPQQYAPPAQPPPQYYAPPQQNYGASAYPTQPNYPPPGYPGAAPYGGYGPVPVRIVTNGTATAALVLGICGFILMGIPFGIGLVFGGIPDILAVVLGIVALNNNAARAGVGRGPAVVGLVLGSVSLLSVFIGAGWLW